MKKYELTNETKEFGTRTLYLIRALRDIPKHEVVAGDLGGWVESESNLSQVGDSWVSDDAYVSGNAWVYGNAHVYGDAIVSGRARVYNDARVYGDACVTGNAHVYGRAHVYGDAIVTRDARVSGDARVYDNARVSGNAWVSCDAWVSGRARVYGNAWVHGDARATGDAHVYGDAIVSGHACITGNARLPSRDSIFTASYVGTENGTLTVTSGVSGLVVTRGCFTGSVDEFLEKSRTVHDDKTHNEYRMLIDVAKSRILVHAVPDTKD